MRRRDLMTMLGGAALAAPFATPAVAYGAALPTVGILNGGGQSHAVDLGPFREGLGERGFVEGRNVSIVVRSASDPKDLSRLAAEFVAERVGVLVSFAGTAAAYAAVNATKSIPVVFATGADPVKLGFVSSINRPGGNVTGVMLLLNGLGGKRLGILHELVPAARRIGFLFNPNNPSAARDRQEIETAAASLGLTIESVAASNGQQLADAFSSLGSLRCEALVLAADGYFSFQPAIVQLAAQHALPTIYTNPDNVAAGGLVAYGSDLPEATRQQGVYAGRILRGEKPGDLPVLQSAKFQLTLNLKTAKALGLAVPPTLLAITDQVVE